MPRYKGICGCYSRQDAKDLGLVPAVVWNDMLRRSEHFDMNPMWYDQGDAAERLGISVRTLYRAVDKLVEEGRITKKVGYRPDSTVTTTWIKIDENYYDVVPGSDNLSGPIGSDNLSGPILNINNNINNKGTSKEKSSSSLDDFISLVLSTAGFSPTASKIREATPAAKKALQDKVPKEDIIKAAEAIKLIKEGKIGNGLTPSVRSPFQRPDFWAAQKPAEAPKGAWNG